MKKIYVLFLSLTLLLSSCTSGLNLVKKTEAYVKKHCPKTTVADPFSGNLVAHYECGELWKVEALDKYCAQMTICLDVVNGKIWGDIMCDSLIDPHKALKAAKK